MMALGNILRPHISDYFPQFRQPKIMENDDNNKQADSAGDMSKSVRDILDKESELD